VPCAAAAEYSYYGLDLTASDDAEIAEAHSLSVGRVAETVASFRSGERRLQQFAGEAGTRLLVARCVSCPIKRIRIDVHAAQPCRRRRCRLRRTTRRRMPERY
jgi:hypothetical protein